MRRRDVEEEGKKSGPSLSLEGTRLTGVIGNSSAGENRYESRTFPSGSQSHLKDRRPPSTGP